MFTAQGYGATAISAVAARAGVGQGTIYRYFGSKREILDHVIDFGVEKFLDSLRVDLLVGTAESVPELLDGVRAGLERVYDLIDRDPQFMRLLLVEAGAIDAELSQRLFGLEAMAASLVAAELARGMAAGWIRADIDADALAHTIIVLVVPWMMRELHGTRDPAIRSHSTATVLVLLEKSLRVRGVA
ncbi:TetR/AcrR family transcriptional regulator [Nocardia yamanashiensis]|uniref:TetR/AcrR family transcriptional regulator n=1 Tax=Nocardia yamanashiensis TaxID=209247 RepID=UPI001E56B9CE|nr:TetR/AcrR family transcriptional regulator [Nocardia yamanashiensis]UGT44540.1 TetR/AcrR family transcriptional regulator [Nocardia yamanashiensis]